MDLTKLKFWQKKESKKIGFVQKAFSKFNSQFKGEVKDDKVKFPKELGVEHPFDARITEGLYDSFGPAKGAVDTYIDLVIGPGFFVKSEDKRAQKIIEDFNEDVDMDNVLRAWLKEALVDFSGFLELGGGKDEVPQGLKILDPKSMYKDRDDKGKTKVEPRNIRLPTANRSRNSTNPIKFANASIVSALTGSSIP